MLKKILLAAAVLASASFATWDYFPVKEAGKGSAKGGFYYDKDHDWSQLGLNIGIRFTIASKLEISLQNWGYQFFGETDCSGCANGGNGLRDLQLGFRYQIIPQANFFVDINFPIGTDEYDGPGTTVPGSDEFFLYLGGQYSMSLPSLKGLSFGAEGAFLWGFERKDYERGLDLHLGGELDYLIPKTKVTPYLGLKFIIRMTESTYEEGKTEYGYDDDGSHEFNLWLGAKFELLPQLTLDGRFIFRNEDIDQDDPEHHPIPNKFHLGGDATGIYLGCEYSF